MRLNPKSEDRIIKLATQLNYRLNEGGGEAFYELGISNDGLPVGITEEEARRSLEIIDRIVESLGAKYMIVRKEKATRGYVYELLIRKTIDVPPIQISVVMLGNVDAGKSTLKGVLVSGMLDDGDGLAMSQVARYLHELKFRRSSSITYHILGFDDLGASVNDGLQGYNESGIYLRSSKVIVLVDLAGHERYLKTTLKGILGSIPDYAALIVAGNAGPIGSFREHLGISVALGIPSFIVITKIDMTPKEVLSSNIRKATEILKLPGVNKIPFPVKSENDCAIAARNMPHGRVVPIFLISNVTGEGLDLLKRFLNLLPPRLNWSDKGKEKFLTYVDDKFNVSGVGVVVSGLVESGSLSIGQRALLGPFDDGSFRTVRVKSIHVSRVSVERATAGQFATFAITNVEYEEVRKGMVLLNIDSKPRAVRIFKASIRVLHHPTTIKVGYEPVIQLRTIRQPIRLIQSPRPFLRTGDKAEVVFKFIRRPEYIRAGDTFVFREGKTKGLGEITKILE